MNQTSKCETRTVQELEDNTSMNTVSETLSNYDQRTEAIFTKDC